jgi:hypothetical protein
MSAALDYRLSGLVVVSLLLVGYCTRVCATLQMIQGVMESLFAGI